MDKLSVARIRIEVLTKEKKRIDQELKRFKAIIKESKQTKEKQV